MASRWALAARARVAAAPLQALASPPGWAVMGLMGNQIWSEPPARPSAIGGRALQWLPGATLSALNFASSGARARAWAWPAGSDASEMTKSVGGRLMRRYRRCC
jgi:hypothetical protein